MKKIILLLFLTINLTASAQVSKRKYTSTPTLFFDLDSIKISQRKFQKILRSKSEEKPYQTLFYIKDSKRIFKLILDKDSGILSKDEYRNLMSSINGIKSKPKKEFTIIQYHPGKEIGCGFKGNKYDYKYLQLLKLEMSFNNYWIHKKDTNLIFDKPKNIDWQQDESIFVEELFFRYPYRCGSFVIINNDSLEYKANYGEYGETEILKVAEEMLKKK